MQVYAYVPTLIHTYTLLYPYIATHIHIHIYTYTHTYPRTYTQTPMYLYTGHHTPCACSFPFAPAMVGYVRSRGVDLSHKNLVDYKGILSMFAELFWRHMSIHIRTDVCICIHIWVHRYIGTHTHS